VVSDSKKYVEVDSVKYLRADSDPLLQASMDAQIRTPSETGRYQLREAAQAIENGTGERPFCPPDEWEGKSKILKQIIIGVANKILITYDPGSNVPYLAPQGKIRSFYEEAYWNDLNDWLKISLPRIIWRFPKPAPNPDEVKSDQNAAEQPPADNNKDVDKTKWKPRSIELSLQLYADGMKKNDLAKAIKKELDSGNWINRNQKPVGIQSILKDGVHESLTFEPFGVHRKS
jgi:hypothetical protein